MKQQHVFSDTGHAYDRTQTDDEIRDGDVLVVPSEGVVGVLLKAWPVAVTVAAGKLHEGLKEGNTWFKDENEYLESAFQARRLAAQLGYAVRVKEVPPYYPDDPACATCGTELHFRAHYGAPGVGQAWSCENGHEWVKVSGEFHDPATLAHVASPEDVR